MTMSSNFKEKHDFPKKVRVRSKLDFDRVYQQGTRLSDRLLLINGLRTDGPLTRLGLAVSKRCGNAVARNRWKRLLREAFRLSRAELPSGLNIVVQPRAGESPQLDDVRQSLVRLVRRLAAKLPPSSTSGPNAANAQDTQPTSNPS